MDIYDAAVEKIPRLNAGLLRPLPPAGFRTCTSLGSDSCYRPMGYHYASVPPWLGGALCGGRWGAVGGVRWCLDALVERMIYYAMITRC